MKQAFLKDNKFIVFLQDIHYQPFVGRNDAQHFLSLLKVFPYKY